MKNVLRSLLTFVIVTASAIGCWPSRLAAQAPVPLTEDRDSRGAEERSIPREAQLAAEEYLDVLQQLGVVLADYSVYLRELDPKRKSEITAKLQALSRNIERGEYSVDVNALSDALRTYVAALRVEEAQLKEQQAREEEGLARTLRNLRVELSMIEGLVQSDIAEQMAEQAKYRDAIRLYVRESLRNSQVSSKGIAVAPFVFNDSITVVITGDSLDERYLVMVPRVPDVPDVPDIPNVPSTPRVIVVPDVPPVPPVGAPSMKGLPRVITRSLSVASPAAPIEIVLEAGDVQVLGSADPAITATLEVEVAAKSRTREKELVSAVTLSLTGDQHGYSVTAGFPAISDPDTKVIRTVLRVEVPDENPLIVRNTFGQVGISDMLTSIDVSGDHSTFAIADCRGDIKLVNTMGPVGLSDVDGVVHVTNSYGPIALDFCRGEIAIENMYGEVSLRDTDGEISIKNSGTIWVREHTGPLRVDNSNGVVDIADVRGNLTAFNSFQPLLIRDIDGDVRVENTNATITLTDINGKSSAANRFGTIQASQLAGPLDLVNENGAIDLTIDRALSSRSTVRALSGPVTIWLDENSDLLVSAETLEGTIAGSFPMEITDDGERRETRLKLGSGATRLAITGTRSAITINKR
jgi:DUF4097 and DUF4098 domain-containing protein YvlB